MNNRAAVSKKYEQSEKGKKNSKKYRQSEKRRKVQKRYNQSEKGKKQSRKNARKFNQSPKGKKWRLQYNRKRRAMKKSLSYWLPFYDMIWIWAKELTFGYCPMCGEPFDNGIHKLEMDHIIPISKGGIHCISNVLPLCKSCNCSKGNKLLFEE